MAKTKYSSWSIFWQSIKLYFKNIGSFLKYMAFPVLGQVFGITLAFVVSYFYSLNVSKTASPESLYENFSMIILILLLVTLPGFLVFAKAFWDYLVAYGAVNSMVDNMVKSGKVYDFPAHTQVITRKTTKYVGLWLVIGLLSSIGMFPLFWVVAGIMFVYFILVFQVFTFEPDKSIFECFQKSVLIIKGNFANTVLLMLFVGALTYWLLPLLVNFLFNFTNLSIIFVMPVDTWAQQLPIEQLNKSLSSFPVVNYQITSLGIAKYIVNLTISYIVVCFTLPLRCICWALWYKNLNKAESKIDKRILDRAEKVNS